MATRFRSLFSLARQVRFASTRAKSAKKTETIVKRKSLPDLQSWLELTSYRGEPKRKTRQKAESPKTKRSKTPAKKTVKRTASNTSRKTRSLTTIASLPARLRPQTSDKHHNLDTFVAYAKQSELNESSSVYKGTHYEYTVAYALSQFNFDLHRVGRANDLGIDLVGYWRLPFHKPKQRGMAVLVQCKVSAPTPAHVRELEGAHSGAPSGWRGKGALAMLVCTEPSTAGVRASLQRSDRPMGVMQVADDGKVRQFLWNNTATELGLQGLGVGVNYNAPPEPETIALTWLGKPI